MDTKQDLNKAIRIWQQHVHTPFFQLMVHVHGRLAVAWIGLCMTVQTPDEECMVGSAVRVPKKRYGASFAVRSGRAWILFISSLRKMTYSAL